MGVQAQMLKCLMIR